MASVADFLAIRAETKSEKTLENQKTKRRREEDPEQIIEQLWTRVYELEDIQQRVENNAAEVIEMAEELAIARDQAESALKQAQKYQQKIKELALYDPLTGLANRNEFNRRFEDAIKIARREDSLVTLLLFDLDHFKDINDSYGHPVGDELLKYVASQLKEATRETDTVARFGGDEFAVILTGLDREDRSTVVADRIIRKLAQPVTLSGSLLETGTSIGISLYPRDGLDPDELLRTSDKALYEAKAKGRGGFQFFDEVMDEQAKCEHILENDLRLAIVRNEFVLHFQPQLAAGRDEIVCAEALVRWKHPTRGLLLPGEFIDAAAEANGLVTDIGQSILVAACRQGKEWDSQGFGSFRIAVNVSTIQFKDEDFVKIVESAPDRINKTGFSPNRLELEITESLMMDKIESVAEKLEQLRVLGVSVAVDDFGTGYSSLAYLKRLPIQKLKIDKTFIDNLVDDPGDMAIAEAVINMGHSLGLDVIAEGVELEKQADALLEKGCDKLQGYLFSRPLPPDEFSRWLSARRTESTN